MEKPSAKSATSDSKNCSRVRAGPRHKPAKNLGTPEPDLVMLLGEPEIRLLMQVDGVDEREMLEMFDVIRVQLRSNSETKETSQQEDPSTDEYRPGVGIMLLNERGEVSSAAGQMSRTTHGRCRRSALTQGKRLARRYSVS